MENCQNSFTLNSTSISLSDRIKAYINKIKTRVCANNQVITICYSTHRPEILSLMKPILDLHDIIILEEPSVPEFKKLMSEEIPLDEYVESGDFTFPTFQSLLYKTIINLTKTKPTEVHQIDPYLETLLNIHETFANGGSASDLTSELHRQIYETEKTVTGVLLQYYHSVLKGKFEESIKRIVQFAREDAARIKLRDNLRARKTHSLLSSKMRPSSRIFIEAGYIHLWLFKALKKLVPNNIKLVLFFPACPIISFYLEKRHVYTPGDILTLSFLFGTNRRDKFLLAARSLIFTKILLKHEIMPENKMHFPHTLDEIECVELVRRLSLDDCKKVFKTIKTAKSYDARKAVKNFIIKQYGMKNVLANPNII